MLKNSIAPPNPERTGGRYWMLNHAETQTAPPCVRYTIDVTDACIITATLP